MGLAATESSPSAGTAALTGTAIGISVLLLYIVAGLLFGSWNVGEFLSYLTIETAASLLLVRGMGIATFTVPVALFVHSRIRAPLVLLGVVVVGWLACGLSFGMVRTGAVFGLGLYAIGLSPLSVVLSFFLGGGEYCVRPVGGSVAADY
jgi:hypothetical protein